MADDAKQFPDLLVPLLWPIPESGITMEAMLKRYCFVNRDGMPPREKFCEAVGAAIQTGIVGLTNEGRVVVAPAWYRLLHQFDETTPNEIESITEFEEFLLSKPWPILNRFEFYVTEDEYRSIVNRANQLNEY